MSTTLSGKVSWLSNTSRQFLQSLANNMAYLPAKQNLPTILQCPVKVPVNTGQLL